MQSSPIYRRVFALTADAKPRGARMLNALAAGNEIGPRDRSDPLCGTIPRAYPRNGNDCERAEAEIAGQVRAHQFYPHLFQLGSINCFLCGLRSLDDSGMKKCCTYACLVLLLC